MVFSANEGQICDILKFLGTLVQNDSSHPYVFWQHLVKSITNHRKIQRMQTQFCCAMCNYNYNFLKTCIYF
jgi:hypothetical protein